MLRFGIARGACLITIAPAAFLALPLDSGTGAGEATLPQARPALAPRVACGAPGSLRLRRFEDRSAQLLCGRRVIVRVSVPG